jgi:hypothetical protein
MWGRANMQYALSLEHLLELGLATPSGELAAIVRQDLPGSSPLAYSTLREWSSIMPTR